LLDVRPGVFNTQNSTVSARGSQSFSDLVSFQHFDRRTCTPKLSYDKNAEENNKKMFTNKRIMNFENDIH